MEIIMANQIETISLVNNSIISAIDKIHPQKDDTLIFYLRTDENGHICTPLDECQRIFDLVQDILKRNYDYKINVAFIQDSIHLNSVTETTTAHT